MLSRRGERETREARRAPFHEHDLADSSDRVARVARGDGPERKKTFFLLRGLHSRSTCFPRSPQSSVEIFDGFIFQRPARASALPVALVRARGRAYTLNSIERRPRPAQRSRAQCVRSAHGDSTRRPEQDPSAFHRAPSDAIAATRLQRAEASEDIDAICSAFADATYLTVDAASLTRARARLDALEAEAESQARRESLGLGHVKTPDDFMCPITYNTMVDPVVASDGHS